MSDETFTQYYFIPCLRRGLSSQITDTELASGEQRAKLTMELDFGPGTKFPKPIELIGPGDVLGFDPRIVSRTDPLNNVGDFEPNYFPSIEFTEPEFPWRMTPMKVKVDEATREIRLRPWITLIVLLAEPVPGESGIAKEFEEGIEPTGEGVAPATRIPTITITSKASLPNLEDAWRWAHVQVTGEAGLNETLDTELAYICETEPERVVSRLICARRLRSGRKYQAFVVPTFKLGVNQALGIEEEGVDASKLAWDETSPDKLTLPYYYKWEFRTGQRGDFEHLVRLLEPRVLPELGLRTVDCSQPGFELAGPEQLGFESVFRSPSTVVSPWGLDDNREPNAASEFRSELATRLNNSSELYPNEQDPDADPIVVAPVYGRWHRAKTELTSNNTGDWWDELNLDPRHRFAAGVGAEFVRKNQEQLMAAAWDQLGQIQEANEIIRRAQLARETGKRLERRLAKLSLSNYLRATAPLHHRVLYAPGQSQQRATVMKALKDSPIGRAPLDPAVRRIARTRGDLRKRQGADLHDDMIVRLNKGRLTAAASTIPARGMPNLEQISARLAMEDLPHIPDPPRGEREGNFAYTIADPKINNVELIEGPPWLTVTPESGGFRLGGVPPTPPRVTQRYQFKIKITFEGRSLTKTFTLSVRMPRSELITTSLPRWQITEISADIPVNPGQEIRLRESNLGQAFRVINLPASDPEYTTIQAVTQMLRNDGWLTFRVEGNRDQQTEAPLDNVRTQLVRQLAADRTLSARLRERVSRPFKDRVGTMLDGKSAQDAEFVSIMAAPEFPQPLFEYIAELSQELVLGGIEKVPQNTIASLNTNRRFLEAVMCGANHEMARELLWREYPTDQRGSYFRMFFDSTDYVPDDEGSSNPFLSCFKQKIQYNAWNDEDKRRYLELYQGKLETGQELGDALEPLLCWQAEEEAMKDVAPLHTWRAKRLGDNRNTFCPAVERDDRLVILIRGDVLKKYPNTVIYAVERIDDKPALPEFNTEEGRIRYPVFTARLKPDIAMVAFDIGNTAEEYENWYFVLEERVSETRFGMDIEISENNDISWEHFEMQDAFDEYVTAMEKYEPWRNQLSSAKVAMYTMQKPMRLIVSGKRLLSGL